VYRYVHIRWVGPSRKDGEVGGVVDGLNGAVGVYLIYGRHSPAIIKICANDI
jgi:hypothetical protein